MPLLTGFAMFYGVRTPVAKPGCFDTVVEIVLAGAFTESVRNPKVYACWQHDPRQKITSPLTLIDDPRGLWFAIDLDHVPADLTGISVEFLPVAWSKRSGVYTLKKAELTHVALLRRPEMPAYSGTLETLALFDGCRTFAPVTPERPETLTWQP